MKPTSDISLMTCSPIVELRRYTLHPGQRDTLIDLFEREFIESQEAVGIELIGLFRDLDDPNAFVWLRGFPDMEARRHSLAAFYDGPVWKAHREAANVTMVDSDDVRLLRPAFAVPTPALTYAARPAHDADALCQELVIAAIYSLDPPAEDAFLDTFEQTVTPSLAAAGASVLGSFVTERSVNTFPRLPVREGENVFVCFWSPPDPTASAEELALLLRSGSSDGTDTEASPPSKGNPSVWRLLPTRRSRLR